MKCKGNLLQFRRELTLDSVELRAVNRAIASIDNLIGILKIPDSSDAQVAHYPTET